MKGRGVWVSGGKVVKIVFSCSLIASFIAKRKRLSEGRVLTKKDGAAYVLI